MNAQVTHAWRAMLVVAFQFVTGAASAESLHALIDQHLKPLSGMEVQRCSDAEFLRRASLDLNGMPPTADEARAFLADTAPDKRERLVDRLLASPHYVRHLATTLDLMLMERRANTHVTAEEWQAWMLKSVRENKPWNVLAREILLADGDDPSQRPPARFALDRASEPNLLTRDIGRVFFGRDMQCAQCHDHPIVEDYLQSDYHGLLAFVAPTYPIVRTEGDKQVTLQAEKAGNDLTFESVFLGVKRRTGARVPDGLIIDEPFFLPGEEYQVAPADNVKAVPKFSRRAKLAELATDGSNQAFNHNIVNRLWAHMLGRGLVHPLDLHHPDNPATDPELLRILSEHFVATNFDIRGFLREIALSDVYQRPFDAPADLLAIASQAVAEVAQLEQQRPSLEAAAKSSTEAYASASETWNAAEAAMLPVAGELDTVRAQYAEAKTKLDEATKAAADATAQLQAKQAVAEPVQQAATAAEQAVKALADDKELAEAAAKFVTRSQQLVAEVAALSKAAEEKSAAMPPLTDAWNNAKPPVDAALTKVTPLTTSFKQAEQAMLVVRTQAATDERALAALDRRLATARSVAGLPALDQAIVLAKQAVPACDAAIIAAQKELTDFAPVLAKVEADVLAATNAMTVATQTLEVARAEGAKRSDLVAAIQAAFDATEAARLKLPDDALLADAATKLRERALASQSEMGETQTQIDAATAAQDAASKALAALQATLVATVAQRAEREQAMNAANQAQSAAQADVAAKQAQYDQVVAELTERWTTDFTVAALKPLTPEQLCWSVFRVTGVYESYWHVEVAELDKTAPLTDEQKQDLAQVAARTVDLEQRTFEKLKANVATFVGLYGAGAGQPQGDFFSTADQALFAANGGVLNSWIAPSNNNVTDRVIKQSDPLIAAEELYLGVLARLPTEAETAEVVTYLSSRTADRNVAAQELVWSLLNLAEFRFNH